MQSAKDVTMLREAVTAAKSGDKPLARKLLQEVIAANPESEQAWLWRAAVAETRDEAMQHLERVLALNPNNQQALSTLAAYRIASPKKTMASRPPGASPSGLSAPAGGSPAYSSPVQATPPSAGPSALPVETARPSFRMPARPGFGTAASDGPGAASTTGSFAPAAPLWRCPFCSHSAASPAEQCPQCKAITVLRDLDAIAKHGAVDEKLLTSAIDRYTPLTSGPEAFEAHCRLALAHLNLKSSSEALPHLVAAQRLRPEDTTLKRELATLQQRKVVMVVDDSPTIRKVVALTLEKHLYRVVLAADGMQAVARLSEATPNLVLLDITMPRMDGYQVCKIIKQNSFTKSIPVVMLSGNDGFFDKVKGRIAGATDYMTKPFEPAALLKTLNRFLQK